MIKKRIPRKVSTGRGVYLLHFASPISPDSPCQHYIGYADNIKARLHKHKYHPDARLLQVAKARGIAFMLAAQWLGGSRKLERQLKNRHNAPRICPICRAKAVFRGFDAIDVQALANVPEIEF